MDLIRLDIIGVSDSLSSGGAYLLVLGEVDGNRRLPIVIGSQEAQAINMARKGSKPPRPLTHDVLCDAFEEMGGEVLDVVIDDLREGTFFAKIRFVHNGKERYLDSRPSDVIALAVCVPVAIFVAPSILDEAGISAEETNGDISTEEEEE